MGREYSPLQRKRQRIKGQEGWVLSRYSIIPAAVYFVIGAISLAFWSEIRYWGALILWAMGLPLLIAALNCRVTMNNDSLTVRGFFGRSKTYDFAEIDSYRQNQYYVHLYLTNGKRLRLRVEDEVDDRFSHLLCRLKRSRSVQRSGVSHSRLYWGNCSRPAQLTLFLLVLSLFSLVSLAFAAVGMTELLKQEDDLERVSVQIASVETEDFIFLYDGAGERYDIYTELGEGKDWNNLVGSRVTMLVDQTREIYALTDASGRAWFTFAQYRDAEFGATLTLTLIAALIGLGICAMIVLVFAAYRDPDAHPRLYQAYETMNFWSRH